MVRVKVPATSANIGPGFDSLGMAVNLYNTFEITEINKGLEIVGCEDEFSNEGNLIYRAMSKAFSKVGYKAKGIKIEIKDDIPISRGLGSSASCIVAGIVGANELAGGILREDEIVKLATEMEGHPDNVVPALIGGMTVSIMENNNVYYSKIDLNKELKLCALIPEFRLSTERARAVLPKTIPFHDGVYNIGRAALLISSLVNGDFQNLKVACQDKLHQDYRGSLIEGYDDIINECKRLDSLGVFLSGAGPTIMNMLGDDNGNFSNRIDQYLKSFNIKWQVMNLSINTKGTEVERL